MAEKLDGCQGHDKAAGEVQSQFELLQIGEIKGTQGAQTVSTQANARDTVSMRRACAEISAAAAKKPIASAKSACSNAG